MHVGIDLGTTFSLIARVDAVGIPVLFPDRHEAERFKTPSVVHVGPEEALVGQAVEELLEDVPELPVARFAKLSMGRDEPIYPRPSRSGLAPGSDLGPDPQEASPRRRGLYRRADRRGDHQRAGAFQRLAAPGDTARRELAGLNVIDLVEEPLAAATHYGADIQYRRAARSWSTTWAAARSTPPCCMSISKGLYALATDGASDLGGKNFDEAIMRMIADQFRLAHRYDPLQDPIVSAQLRRQAEAMKIKLAMPGQRRGAQGDSSWAAARRRSS